MTGKTSFDDAGLRKKTAKKLREKLERKIKKPTTGVPRPDELGRPTYKKRAKPYRSWVQAGL